MNLKAIVRTYVMQFRPNSQAELEWFKQKPTLVSAIQFATLAINSRGKRYSHQRRLKKAVLEEAKHILLSNRGVLAKCKTFEKLFVTINTLLEPVYGIGELYVYDTALRIGAHLDLLPTKVYLHAGTGIGAHAIGFTSAVGTIEVSALPKELQLLEPYEIEDVLCLFKKNVTEMSAEDMSPNRSWCG